MKPQQKIQLLNKFRIQSKDLYTGITTVIVAIGIFFYTNIGFNSTLYANADKNLGFEKYLYGWKVMKGNWNNNEKLEFVRTGTKSSRLTATKEESLLIGTYSCIQVPANGNYKIKITAYAKSRYTNDKAAVGIKNIKNFIELSIDKNLSVIDFTKLEYEINVENNQYYFPILSGTTSLSSSDIFFDDVSFELVKVI